jgi:hypothetical protein
MVNKMTPINKIAENKITFLFINIFLFLGVAIMVFALLYLAFHLDNSDKLFFKFVPVFVIGITLVLIYRLLKGKSQPNRRLLKHQNIDLYEIDL